ncbi:hypothetical protein, partial [Bifidobacterium sp.]|uniref:hypothetical protein n=1 Tax=Bifidobacterium sp. TaxID=41200 RepID=UPI0038655B25
GVAGGYIIEQAMGERIERLEAENAKLLEDLEFERSENGWAREFLNRMGQKCGTKDCPSLVAYVTKLESENAKLRTFLGGDSIVTDYWKDEDGTMHVLTTDGEHTYEYMRGGLADENAKLRELADELWWLADGYVPDNSELDHVRDMMRELGIEVPS